MGSTHLDIYSKLNDVEVIAIADSIQSRLDGSSKAEGNISGQAEGGVVGLNVKKYLDGMDLINNPDITFDELSNVFPPSLQNKNGRYGVFAKTQEIEEKHHVRYFMKEDDRVTLADTEIAVCTQWGIDNIPLFLNACKSLDLKIS